MKKRTIPDYGPGKCPNCGKEFTKRTTMHTFCCKKCKEAYYRSGGERSYVQDRDSLGLEGWRQCKVCGTVFRLVNKYSRALYCCEECKKEAAKQRYLARRYSPHRLSGKGQTAGKNQSAPPAEKDGFTWAEIRGVLGEYGISSYHKAVEILQQRKREREIAIQIETKGGGEE